MFVLLMRAHLMLGYFSVSTAYDVIIFLIPEKEGEWALANRTYGIHVL